MLNKIANFLRSLFDYNHVYSQEESEPECLSITFTKIANATFARHS